MAAPYEDHRLVGSAITVHAWNGDRSKLALCPNNNEVHIYAKKGAKWELEDVLKEVCSPIRDFTPFV